MHQHSLKAIKTNLYHSCTFPFILALLYAAAGSTFTVSSGDDQATSNDHLHPSLPSHKMLIYSLNLLTISLPLPLLVNSNCNLSIITHPIVTSHFQISNNFTSESYLSHCYLTQQQLLYCHSPHCHPSLLVLIVSNLILQINIQIFTLSLMRFIPKEKNELNKWKNHFVEMKGDVGMSVHEKEGKQVNASPTHKTIYNPIPTSLFF